MFLLRGHTDPPIWSSSLIELDPRPLDHIHPINGAAAFCTRILVADIEVGGRGAP